MTLILSKRPSILSLLKNSSYSRSNKIIRLKRQRLSRSARSLNLLRSTRHIKMTKNCFCRVWTICPGLWHLILPKSKRRSRSTNRTPRAIGPRICTHTPIATRCLRAKRVRRAISFYHFRACRSSSLDLTMQSWWVKRLRCHRRLTNLLWGSQPRTRISLPVRS